MQVMSATYMIVVTIALVVHWAAREHRQVWCRSMAVLSIVTCVVVDPRLGFVVGFAALWVMIVTAGIRRDRHRTAWRRVGVIVSVGVLGATRFATFLVDSADSITGWFGFHVGWRPDGWWVPLGISFLAFQVISVIVDASRDNDDERMTLSETVLVLAFFPKVVAGPLVRAKGFVAQLRSIPTAGAPMATVVVLVVAALFKKVVLAGILFDFDTATTAAGSSMTAWDAVVKMIVGPLRFFFDVSAYTDLVIAVGLMIGITFPANFDRPFSAVSMGDFWRRWHMSVSLWFRDYIQAPLAGRSLRPRAVQACAAIMVTMFLSGLWHGAAWTVVLWGVAHGVVIAFEWLLKLRAVDRRRNARRAGTAPVTRQWPRPLAIVATFGFVALTSPLFSGADISTSVSVWAAFGSSWTSVLYVTPFVLVTVAGSLAWCAAPASTPERVVNVLERAGVFGQAFIAAAVTTAIVGFAGTQPAGFLYWGF